MSISITMPALSPTMTEGKLAKWFVKAGDAVRSGDVIAEIETDKAMMEVEAMDDGVITALHATEGEEGIAVGTAIADMEGEDASPAVSAPAEVPVVPTPTQATTQASTQVQHQIRHLLRLLPPAKIYQDIWFRPRSEKLCVMRWLKKCAAMITCF
jgi:pyruvate/2-oxoglutarate dehydrogenase complex dihydrolipoamide acyltransferase (E2) component